MELRLVKPARQWGPQSYIGQEMNSASNPESPEVGLFLVELLEEDVASQHHSFGLTGSWAQDSTKTC